MIKKIITLLFLMFSFSTVLFSQTTNVTATITDSDGITWTSAQWSISFVTNGIQSNPCIYQLNGQSLCSNAWRSYLSKHGTSDPNTGAISVVLLDNTQITPSGTKFVWTIQSNTSAPATQYTPLIISGASMDLSSYLSINSIAPRFAALGPQSYGYSDVEINPIPNPGAYYYNNINQTTRQWSGPPTNVWQNLVASSWNGGTVSNLVASPGFSCTGSPSTCYSGNLHGNVNGATNVYSKNVNNDLDADQYCNTPGTIDSSCIPNAITALPSTGGTVYLTCGQEYPAPGPTSLPSHVFIKSRCVDANNDIVATNQNMYTTSIDYNTNLTISPSNGNGFEFVNLNFSGTSHLTIQSTRAYYNFTVACADTITTDTCVTLSATNTQNTQANQFPFVIIQTAGAQPFEITGQASLNFYATNNIFGYVALKVIKSVSGAGPNKMLGFGVNSDTNTFGHIQMFCTNVTSLNGIIFNDTATPGLEVDADNETIGLLDNTGNCGTGTAITVNASKGNNWREGFGLPGFSTIIAVNSTYNPHFYRVQLDDNVQVCMGKECLNSDGGLPQFTLTLPQDTNTTLVTPATNNTFTNKSWNVSSTYNNILYFNSVQVLGTQGYGYNQSGSTSKLLTSEPQFDSYTFATLPTGLANGTHLFCSDCTNLITNSHAVGTAAATGGPGADVIMIGGTWLTQN